MSDEEWVKAATVDDAVVAELLVMLKQVKQPPPPPLPAKPALSLEWSVRQRRSKAVTVQAKKQAPRASPTTPLSWSAATSLSGGGGVGGGSGNGSGGCSVDGGPEEESSRPYPFVRPPKRFGISRSKHKAGTTAIGTSETTINKRSRKKKTLAELKEEESVLQKERRQLKRELATLCLNLEKERARNENFKRMKLELQALPAVENGLTVKSDLAILDQPSQKMACVDPVPALLPPTVANNGGSLPSPPENTCSEGNKELAVDTFVLPDLNIPFEENSSSHVLCGGIS